MNNMNVIIADDHPIVLFGIRKSLEQIEWVNVVGEFEDSTALINNLPKLDAHVLITDLSMPGDKYGDGITLIKYIKRHFPDISIIVLTMNNNPAILSACWIWTSKGCAEQAPRPICQKRSLRCRKARSSRLRASLVCWKKSARVATVTNACPRKRVRFCACSQKVSW